MDRTPHILIVEDNEDHYGLIQAALEEGGYPFSAERIQDGEALLNRLREDSPPDLILLDLHLRRMDGREVLRSIKQSTKLRRIPVVVLTTSRSREDVNLAYQLGANAFFRKPAGYHELVDLMTCVARYWFDEAELPARSGREADF